MVQWTAEKQSIVLLGVLEYENITFSNGLLQHIANKIGEGCTPKAVKNQLQGWRSKAQAIANANAPDGDNDGALATPDTTPAKPKATPKRGRANKKIAAEDDNRSPTKGKRGRKVNDQGSPQAKKVKTEASGLLDNINAQKIKTEPEAEDEDAVGDALEDFDATFQATANDDSNVA